MQHRILARIAGPCMRRRPTSGHGGHSYLPRILCLVAVLVQAALVVAVPGAAAQATPTPSLKVFPPPPQGPKPPHVKPVPNVAALPVCQGGPYRPSTSIPANPQQCRAVPVSQSAPGWRNRRSPEAPPQASGGPQTPGFDYYYGGAATQDASALSIYGALYTRNVGVPHDGSAKHFVGRYLAKADDSSRWIEAGFIERASDANDVQWIYQYDTEIDRIQTFPQYPITSEMWLWFDLVYAGQQDGRYQAWLWWNGSWNLLREAVLYLGYTKIEAFGEVAVESGGFPFDAGTSFYGAELQGPWSLNWTPWTTSYPTLEVVNAPYAVNWRDRYQFFDFYKP